MTRTSVVENIGAVAHRYEHRATRKTYVWPVGEAREVPEEVALSVTEAHPGKMRLLEGGRCGEGDRTGLRQAQAERGRSASPPERGHAHRWRRNNVCRCGLRREDHRPHSHAWRRDGTCRCGLSREEIGRR